MIPYLGRLSRARDAPQLGRLRIRPESPFGADRLSGAASGGEADERSATAVVDNLDMLATVAPRAEPPARSGAPELANATPAGPDGDGGSRSTARQDARPAAAPADAGRSWSPSREIPAPAPLEPTHRVDRPAESTPPPTGASQAGEADTDAVVPLELGADRVESHSRLQPRRAGGRSPDGDVTGPPVTRKASEGRVVPPAARDHPSRATGAQPRPAAPSSQGVPERHGGDADAARTRRARDEATRSAPAPATAVAETASAAGQTRAAQSVPTPHLPPPPARATVRPSGESTRITVTIDRLEVRASSPPAGGKRSAPLPRRSPSSLASYLARRGGGLDG